MEYDLFQNQKQHYIFQQFSPFHEVFQATPQEKDHSFLPLNVNGDFSPFEGMCWTPFCSIFDCLETIIGDIIPLIYITHIIDRHNWNVYVVLEYLRRFKKLLFIWQTTMS